MISLGIDVGGTSVKAAAWDGARWLWTGQSGFYRTPSLPQLSQAIRKAVSGRLSCLDAVGLCVPGIYDAAKRQITLSINVPCLEGISLDRLVPEALGIACKSGRAELVNDGFAAASDIQRSRQLKGRLLVLALGTGVGISVLDDGVPLRVDGECPGQFGQIDVAIAGEDVIGPDGGAGGLEGYIGNAALAKKYGENVSAALQKFTGEEPAIKALARAIRIAHAIYRPAHIVLCGGLAIRLRRVLPALHKQVATNLTSVARPGWTLDVGDDDFHAARGAAWEAAKACR